MLVRIRVRTLIFVVNPFKYIPIDINCTLVLCKCVYGTNYGKPSLTYMYINRFPQKKKKQKNITDQSHAIEI